MKTRKTRRRMRFLAAVALAIGGSIGVLPAFAPADTFTVNSTADTNTAGTLRYAINQANARSGPQTIVFDLPSGSSIKLNSHLPPISQQVTIDGAGATIDGDGAHRIFFVTRGTPAEISNLTLRGGHAQGGDGGNGRGGGGGGGAGLGGALFVESFASVTLHNVDLDKNEATGGAGGTNVHRSGLGGGGGGGGLGGNGGNASRPGFGGAGGGGAFTGDGGNSSGGTGGAGGGGTVTDGSPNGGPNGSWGGAGGSVGGGAGGGDAGNWDGTNGSNGGGGGGGGDGGRGGNGADYGGGGGGGEAGHYGGGVGGFGGGGGGGSNPSDGGVGGFGGGGGGAWNVAGTGGTGGGNGSTGFIGGGGGGAGFGGAIFVRDGGSLTITGNSMSQDNTTTGGVGGGTGANKAGDGLADGNAMFLHASVNAMFKPGLLDTMTIFDQIGGTGSISMVGDGTAVLNSVNTFTGGTTVRSGTLVLGDALHSGASVSSLVTVKGGTLMGIGTAGGGLTVAGGTVAPGNSIGTLHVTGDYTHHSGLYQVELNAATNPTIPGIDNDLLNVVGDAYLNGGTVDVVALGTPELGTIYRILQAAGTVHGAYDGIQDNLVIRDFRFIDIAPDTVDIEAYRPNGDFQGAGLTPNQQAVGGALDANSEYVTGDFGELLDSLLILQDMDPDAVPEALDQLSGEIHGTIAQIGIQNTNFLYQMLSRRSALAASAYQDNQGVGPELAMNAAGDSLTMRAQGGPSDDWGGWVGGSGMGGFGQTDGNAGGMDKYQWVGGQFGVFRWLTESTAAGVFGAYSNTQISTTLPAQTARVDDYHIAAFLRHADTCSGRYLLLGGGGGFDDYRTARYITLPGIDQVATANYNGNQGVGYAEVGVDTYWGDWNLRPMLAAQYTYLQQDAFEETGAPGANLEVDRLETKSLRSYLGLYVDREFSTRRGVGLRPEAHATWVHEYLDSNTVLLGSFINSGAPAFAAAGLDYGRDWAVLGVGLTADLARLSLFAHYDVQVNERNTFHLGWGGVEFVW